MKLQWVRKICSDGRHNAFTGLGFFDGRWFLAFRNAPGHGGVDSRQMILASDDLREWRIAHEYRRPDEPDGTRHDYRDSYLLADGRRLLLYSCATPVRKDGTRLMTYSQVQVLRAGSAWGEPQLIAEGKVLWKPIRHGGEFFVAAYSATSDEGRDLDLLRSADGLSWERVARIGAGSETVLHPVSPDELLALVRTEARPYYFEFHRSRRPFTKWEKVATIPKIVQGQHLIAARDAVYLIGRERPDYRQTADPERPSFAQHRVKVWRVRDNDLDELLELPSAGDCAYPGAVAQGDGAIVISYYSRHETPDPGVWKKAMPADIFLACVRA